MTEEEALEKWPDSLLRPKLARKCNADSLTDPEEFEQELAERVVKERGRRLKLREAWEEKHNTIITETDPETGKEIERRLLGGAQPNAGRPKRDRATQRVLDAVREDKFVRKMVRALDRGLSSKDDARLGVQTVRTIAHIEAKDAELGLKQDELDKKPEEELRKGLSRMLARLEASGALDMQKLFAGSETIEGTVIEDDGVGPEPAEA